MMAHHMVSDLCMPLSSLHKHASWAHWVYGYGIDFVHPDPCRSKVKPHPLIEELRKFLLPDFRDSGFELSKLKVDSSPGPSPFTTNWSLQFAVQAWNWLPVRIVDKDKGQYCSAAN